MCAESGAWVGETRFSARALYRLRHENTPIRLEGIRHKRHTLAHVTSAKEEQDQWQIT